MGSNYVHTANIEVPVTLIRHKINARRVIRVLILKSNSILCDLHTDRQLLNGGKPPPSSKVSLPGTPRARHRFSAGADYELERMRPPQARKNFQPRTLLTANNSGKRRKPVTAHRIRVVQRRASDSLPFALQSFFRQTQLVISNYVILVSFVGLAALLAADLGSSALSPSSQSSPPQPSSSPQSSSSSATLGDGAERRTNQRLVTSKGFHIANGVSVSELSGLIEFPTIRQRIRYI